MKIKECCPPFNLKPWILIVNLTWVIWVHQTQTMIKRTVQMRNSKGVSSGSFPHQRMRPIRHWWSGSRRSNYPLTTDPSPPQVRVISFEPQPSTSTAGACDDSAEPQSSTSSDGASDARVLEPQPGTSNAGSSDESVEKCQPIISIAGNYFHTDLWTITYTWGILAVYCFVSTNEGNYFHTGLYAFCFSRNLRLQRWEWKHQFYLLESQSRKYWSENRSVYNFNPAKKSIRF